MNVTAIIVNFRTPDDTAKAVAGVLAEVKACPLAHVIVVDNDSGDGSFDVLKASAEAAGWGDRVSIIAAGRNGGYGYGINVAVTHALKNRNPRPDYFYVMNPDAVPDAGAIAGQWAYLEGHPEAGVVGCVVHAPAGEVQGAAFRFPSIWGDLEAAAGFGLVTKLLSKHVVSLVPSSEPMDVDWVPGTSMFIRRALIDQIGSFDEGFFLYFEETDFCMRARKAGWKVAFVPGPGVAHVGSVSTGMSDQLRRMPAYWFQSRHRYFLKHHGPGYTALADAAHLLGRGINRLKERVKPRSPNQRPHFDSDFFNHSVRVLIEPPALEPATPAPAPKTFPDATTTMAALPLLVEDLATYDWKLLEPGFWAVMAHRLGAHSNAARFKIAKFALGTSHSVMATTVDWIWGIEIGKSVRLGRRVRLWHNGCMQLNAKAIGNDVQIRHDTTLGTVRARDINSDHLPIIEDSVELGAGVSVLGPVRVGQGAFVGANSLVLKNVPADAIVVGVPARMVPK